MKTETERTTQTPENILSELRSLVNEAERILGQVPQGSGDRDDKFEVLRERLQAAQQRLTSAYAETKRKVSAGARYADDSIRDHPYESMAIALGVGLLAGALLGRRWKSSAE